MFVLNLVIIGGTVRCVKQSMPTICMQENLEVINMAPQLQDSSTVCSICGKEMPGRIINARRRYHADCWIQFKDNDTATVNKFGQVIRLE